MYRFLKVTIDIGFKRFTYYLNDDNYDISENHNENLETALYYLKHIVGHKSWAFEYDCEIITQNHVDYNIAIKSYIEELIQEKNRIEKSLYRINEKLDKLL
jgi:hypothetical protein